MCNGVIMLNLRFYLALIYGFCIGGLTSFMTHAVSSMPTPAIVGHKPELSPAFKGRLLVGDNITFLPGFHDKDGDQASPMMQYEFFASTADGHEIASLQQGYSTSYFLTPALNGQYLGVKTIPLSVSGDPNVGDPVKFIFPYPIGHLLGVTAVGKGLFVGSEGNQCILDGVWTTGYSPTCVVYRLDPENFGWEPQSTFFEVSYNAAFAASKFIFRGYWRQNKAGSLGIWAVHGCLDINCSVSRKISESKALSFAEGANEEGGTIRVINVRPYYRYRFIYEGGKVDANGGMGSGSFNEIQIE